MKTKKMVRQGDVLVIKGGRKTKAHKVALDRRGAVLAEGEATGHHHRIERGATLLRAEGVNDALLVVDVSGLLVHEEHGSIEIGGGSHTVRRQREYDWAEKSSRRVED